MEAELIDNKPATIILYGDGPGYVGDGTYEAVVQNSNALVSRQNLSGVDTGKLIAEPLSMINC